MILSNANIEALEQATEENSPSWQSQAFLNHAVNNSGSLSQVANVAPPNVDPRSRSGMSPSSMMQTRNVSGPRPLLRIVGHQIVPQWQQQQHVPATITHGCLAERESESWGQALNASDGSYKHETHSVVSTNLSAVESIIDSVSTSSQLYISRPTVLIVSHSADAELASRLNGVLRAHRMDSNLVGPGSDVNIAGSTGVYNVSGSHILCIIVSDALGRCANSERTCKKLGARVDGIIPVLGSLSVLAQGTNWARTVINSFGEEIFIGMEQSIDDFDEAVSRVVKAITSIHPRRRARLAQVCLESIGTKVESLPSVQGTTLPTTSLGTRPFGRIVGINTAANDSQHLSPIRTSSSEIPALRKSMSQTANRYTCQESVRDINGSTADPGNNASQHKAGQSDTRRLSLSLNLRPLSQSLVDVEANAAGSSAGVVGKSSGVGQHRNGTASFTMRGENLEDDDDTWTLVSATSEARTTHAKGPSGNAALRNVRGGRENSTSRAPTPTSMAHLDVRALDWQFASTVTRILESLGRARIPAEAVECLEGLKTVVAGRAGATTKVNQGVMQDAWDGTMVSTRRFGETVDVAASAAACLLALSSAPDFDAGLAGLSDLVEIAAAWTWNDRIQVVGVQALSSVLQGLYVKRRAGTASITKFNATIDAAFVSGGTDSCSEDGSSGMDRAVSGLYKCNNAALPADVNAQILNLVTEAIDRHRTRDAVILPATQLVATLSLHPSSAGMPNPSRISHLLIDLLELWSVQDDVIVVHAAHSLQTLMDNVFVSGTVRGIVVEQCKRFVGVSMRTMAHCHSSSREENGLGSRNRKGQGVEKDSMEATSVLLNLLLTVAVDTDCQAEILAFPNVVPLLLAILSNTVGSRPKVATSAIILLGNLATTQSASKLMVEEGTLKVLVDVLTKQVCDTSDPPSAVITDANDLSLDLLLHGCRLLCSLCSRRLVELNVNAGNSSDMAANTAHRKDEDTGESGDDEALAQVDARLVDTLMRLLARHISSLSLCRYTLRALSTLIKRAVQSSSDSEAWDTIYGLLPVSVLVKAMSIHIHCREVQLDTCELLRIVLQRPPTKEDEGTLTCLIASLETHGEDAAVVVSAAKAIITVTGALAAVKSNAGADSPSSSRSAADTEGGAHKARECLGGDAEEANNSDAVGRLLVETVPSLLRAMSRLPDHGEVQRYVLWAVAMLTSVDTRSHGRIMQSGVLAAAENALETYGNDPLVQAHALTMLANLATTKALAATTNFCTTSLIQVVIACLRDRDAGPRVVVPAMALVGNIAVHEENRAELAGQHNLVVAVLVAVEFSSRKQHARNVAHHAAWLLMRLFKTQTSVDAVFAATDDPAVQLVPRFARIQHQHESDVQITTLLLRAAASLARHAPDRALVANECLFSACSAMSTHEGSHRLQSAAIDCLAAFCAGSPQNQFRVVLEGGLVRVMAAACKHRQHRSLSLRVVRCLALTALHPHNKRRLINAGVLATLHDMLEAHLDDQELVYEVVATLASLAQDDANAKYIADHDDSLEYVFAIIDSHANCSDIVATAVDYLRRLCVTPSLASRVAVDGRLKTIERVLASHGPAEFRGDVNGSVAPVEDSKGDHGTGIQFSCLSIVARTVQGAPVETLETREDAQLHASLIAIVFAMMKANERNSEIQRVACQAVSGYCRVPACVGSIRKHGAIRIVSALSNHLWDRDVIFTAMNAVARLISDPIARASLIPYLPHVIKACEIHLSDDPIQESCCRALCELAEAEEDVDLLASFGIHTIAAAAAAQHPENSIVLHWCLQIIFSIVSRGNGLASASAEERSELERAVKIAKQGLTSDKHAQRCASLTIKKLQQPGG